MTLDAHPDDPFGPVPAQVRSRMAFTFEGELDEVPTDAAAALAGVARALLNHGVKHRGRPATVRMARLGPLLNLWLTDPECSPACLRGSGDLPSTGAQATTAPGAARLVLEPGPEGELRLHWGLVLAEEPMTTPPVTTPPVAARRWGVTRRDRGRTHKKTGKSQGIRSRR